MSRWTLVMQLLGLSLFVFGFLGASFFFLLLMRSLLGEKEFQEFLMTLVWIGIAFIGSKIIDFLEGDKA